MLRLTVAERRPFRFPPISTHHGEDVQTRDVANAVSLRFTRPMDPAQHSPLVTALVAVACVAVAAGIRGLLSPVLGLELPYLTFFAGVMAAAWFGGWRAGVIATAASALATQYFFVEPLGIALPRPHERPDRRRRLLAGGLQHQRLRRGAAPRAPRRRAAVRTPRRRARPERDAAQRGAGTRRAVAPDADEHRRRRDRHQSRGRGGEHERRRGAAPRAHDRRDAPPRRSSRSCASSQNPTGAEAELPVRRAMEERRIIHLTGPAALLLPDGREWPSRTAHRPSSTPRAQ